MATNDRWFRLNATWAESEWLEALEWADRAVWVEMLAYVKTNGSKGRCKAISANRFAGFRMIPVKHVETLLEAATQSGALIIENGEWIIAKWSDYQNGDGSSADRMRRKRLRDAELSSQTDDVTSRDAVTPSRGPLTPDPRQTTNVVLRDLPIGIPPERFEVVIKMKELGFLDPEFETTKFFDFWEGEEWHRGKEPMKNWKSSCNNWKANSVRRNEFPGIAPAPNKGKTPVHGVDFINVELPNGDVAEFKPGFTADDESNPDAWFDRAKWGQA